MFLFPISSIKLGVMEDQANRTRLSKLLRFKSSSDPEKQTSLADYVTRMKDKQEHIYFIAGTSLEEVKNSPFVERLLKKGEILHFLVLFDLVYLFKILHASLKTCPCDMLRIDCFLVFKLLRHSLPKSHQM